MSVDGDKLRAIAKQIEEHGAHHEALQLDLRAAHSAQNKDRQEIEQSQTDLRALWEVGRDLTGRGGSAAEMAKNLTALRDAICRAIESAAIPINGRTLEEMLDVLAGRVANRHREEAE
jgi:hypothetical protein